MPSVVIPAHNEARVIGRCLRAILESDGSAPEILVVCNGCTDRTAEVARSFGAAVRVIEVPQASKTLALNVGDREARSFPRFFVDADVVLSPGALHDVATVLETDEARVAAPQMRLVFDGHPWSVRAYYEIWTRLPYFRDGVIGSGVYAVSSGGRARFDRFPDIIADDEYVRALFASNETRIIESCYFDVTPPRSLSGIVRVSTRFHKGNRELRHRSPTLGGNLEKAYGTALKEILGSPRLWTPFVLYVLVYLISRALAEWKLRTGRLGWERDDESRRRPGRSRPSVHG